MQINLPLESIDKILLSIGKTKAYYTKQKESLTVAHSDDAATLETHYTTKIKECDELITNINNQVLDQHSF